MKDIIKHIFKEHKDYSQQRCNSFVCDVTKDWSEAPFQPGSLGKSDIKSFYYIAPNEYNKSDL